MVVMAVRHDIAMSEGASAGSVLARSQPPVGQRIVLRAADRFDIIIEYPAGQLSTVETPEPVVTGDRIPLADGRQSRGLPRGREIWAGQVDAGGLMLLIHIRHMMHLMLAIGHWIDPRAGSLR